MGLGVLTHSYSVYLFAIWYFKVSKDLNADTATTPAFSKGKGTHHSLFFIYLTPLLTTLRREESWGPIRLKGKVEDTDRVTALP